MQGRSQSSTSSSESMNISTATSPPDPFMTAPVLTSLPSAATTTLFSTRRDVTDGSPSWPARAASPSPLDQRITTLNDEMLAHGLQASLDAEASLFLASTELYPDCRGCQGGRITKRRREQDLRPIAVRFPVVIWHQLKFLHAAFRHSTSLDHPRNYMPSTTLA